MFTYQQASNYCHEIATDAGVYSTCVRACTRLQNPITRKLRISSAPGRPTFNTSRCDVSSNVLQGVLFTKGNEDRNTAKRRS